jgi:type I restriction enzyme M protein
LAVSPGQDEVVWRLIDGLRSELRSEDAFELLVIALGAKAVAQRVAPERWEAVRHASPDAVGEQLRAAVHGLIPLAGRSVDVLDRCPPRAAAEAVSMLETIDVRAGEGATVMTALIDKSADFLGRAGGEFSLPSSLRRLVTEMAQPSGIVYDPAAGLGQLLVESSSEGPATQLFGQEMNRRTWELGTINLAVHDIAATYECGDVFAKDAFPDLLADRVLAVPPFGQLLRNIDQLRDDPRWVFGEPTPKDGNIAWIQHCLHHLGNAGRAYIVMPRGVLFEGGRSGRVRQRIIKAGLLDAVIALPSGMFSNTSIPSVLLVFERNRRNAGSPGSPGSVLMVDASEAGEKEARAATRLQAAAIARVTSLYHAWRQGKLPPAQELVAVAQFDDIVKNDFIIDPRRYLAAPEVFADEAVLQQRRTGLKTELLEAAETVAAADERLLRMLEAER